MAAIPLHCEIYQELRKLDKLRKESDALTKALNEVAGEVAAAGGAEGLSLENGVRMRTLQAELAANHEAEAILTEACVEKVQLLIDTHHKGVKKAAEFNRFTPNKLKRAKTADTRITDPPEWPGDGIPPILCGRVRWPSDLEIPAGFMVVVKVSRARETPNWILGTVMRYFAFKNKYEVEDLDVSDDFDCIRKTYVLSAKVVIPLPYVVPAVFNDATQFAVGDSVIALYPQTTSFYPATVLDVPSETGTGKYVLKFEDDNRDHFIDWRFVLHDPDSYYVA